MDRLLVDEAHLYKNLAAISKMQNVAGISQTESQKASDMYLKCQYLDELTDGHGIVFATGTPISNSMVAAYTMLLEMGVGGKHNAVSVCQLIKVLTFEIHIAGLLGLRLGNARHALILLIAARFLYKCASSTSSRSTPNSSKVMTSSFLLWSLSFFSLASMLFSAALHLLDGKPISTSLFRLGDTLYNVLNLTFQ